MDIAKIIKRKGYTQQQVADLLTINRVNLNNMRQIADVIGANVSDFFEDETDSKRNDFAAYVRCKGIHFTADNIDEFNKIVEEIKIIAK